jgi:3D-(3,5/4)-trihydroxycyclohexane-1,2-dione acylhydrolase (decyclizing)
MKSVRLTMAQALLRFLDNQYLASDGVEHKFVQRRGPRAWRSCAER